MEIELKNRFMLLQRPAQQLGVQGHDDRAGTHEHRADGRAEHEMWVQDPGRQRGLSEQAERTAIIAETLYREQQLGVNEIAQRLNISKVTLYKYLRHRKVVIHAHRKTATAKPAD